MKNGIISRFAAVLMAAAVWVCAACGIVGNSPQKAEEQARVERLIQERLDARSFRVDVDRMIPTRGPSRMLTSPYSVVVDGTRLVSHLPYFGVAYDVPYGGGKALNFDSEIAAYQDEPYKNDSRRIVFTTDNGEDVLTYTLIVFSNGKATLDVRSRNREPVSFQGRFNPDADPSQKEEK